MHHGHMLLLYRIALSMMFLSGMTLNAVSHCYLAMRSSLSGVQSAEQYFAKNTIPICIRSAVSCAFFFTWLVKPDLLNILVSPLKIAVDDPALATLPLNRATAWLFGFFLDMILNRLARLVPALNDEIPPLLGQLPGEQGAAKAA